VRHATNNGCTGPTFIGSDARYCGQRDGTLDITGKVDGGTPETTWYQLCCFGQDKIWARSDMGRIEGPIETVADVPPD
jgi:hypothetical protein